MGVANLNVREGRYANDTAVLQVGRFGRITVCDAGTYICRANQTSSGRAQQRTFKVTVNSKNSFYCFVNVFFIISYSPYT